MPEKTRTCAYGSRGLHLMTVLLAVATIVQIAFR